MQGMIRDAISIISSDRAAEGYDGSPKVNSRVHESQSDYLTPFGSFRSSTVHWTDLGRTDCTVHWVTCVYAAACL